MQTALRARLLNQTAAGTKVHWLTRPQGDALPAITLQTIFGDRPQTYDGFQRWREVTVQLDAWAANYGHARAMLEAAIAALAPRITSNSIAFDRMGFTRERDGTDTIAGTTIYRAGIDLLVRFSPA